MGRSENGHLRRKLQESFPAWAEFHMQLVSARRATLAHVGELKYWVSAERARDFALIFPDTRFASPLPEIGSNTASGEDALLALAAGWMAHCGPVTAGGLGETLQVPAVDIEKTFLRMEASGAVLRGRFAQLDNRETEWCDRRLLARIHRLTLGTLRRQIEPVAPAEFMRWLLRWQHVAPGTQLLGERGSLEALADAICLA